MSDEGRLVAGRYRLAERIGNGAMGVVWRGVDERLNREVAIKQLILSPLLPADEAEEAVARCLREGRIAAKLHHPNAIGVFDVVDADGTPWLVMEYLPSVSLAAELAERGTLPVAEVARIGQQIAAALAAAHAAGIVHRDVKPGNILLGHDGSVKITDFGISRATDDVTVTKTGLIAGTPAYLSPEVAVGRDPSPASDVYSLGSTLYAAIEGEPPFGLTENTLGLLHAVAAGKINPPQRSGALTPVLTALLAAEPEARPSAVRVREMLAAVARGEEPELPPTALVAPVAPADEATRLVAAPAGTGTSVRALGTTGRGRPVAPPPTKSHRPLMFASAGVAVVIAIGAWLLLGNEHEPANGTNDKPTEPVATTSEAVTTTEVTSEAGAPPTTVARTTTPEPTTTTTTAPPTTEPTTTTDPTTSDTEPTTTEPEPTDPTTPTSQAPATSSAVPQKPGTN
ncbi:serine/threonine-protein kinase [Actinokineospora sp. NPDC004072]